MAQGWGKPFKTRTGAQKRARFEQAHQKHLTRRYTYLVEQRANGLFYIARVLETLK